MNNISLPIFLVLTLVIFVWIIKLVSQKIFKIKSKKEKQINIYDVLITSVFGTIISVVVIDVFEVLFRIVKNLITNFNKITVESVVGILKVKYIPEFWLDDLFLKLVILAPLSIVLTLIFLKKYDFKDRT